jgi:hypothetical protein
MSELTEPGITSGATAPAGTPTDATASLHSSPTAGSDTSGQPSAKDKATESAQAGKQAATDVAQTAADNAKNVAAETKAQARNVVSEAKDQLREQTSAQHKSLVSNLRSLADELGSMASSGDQSGVATDLVGKASDRARTTASWLDDRDPAQLVEELRSFARRRPGVFLAGALAAGVVAGRLTRGVAAAHSSDTSSSTTGGSALSSGTSGTIGTVGALPATPSGYDTPQLPTGGAAYPEGSLAYPPPVAGERIDEPNGGRW